MPAIPIQLPDFAQNQAGVLGILRRLENGAQLTGRILRPTTAGQTPIQIGQTTVQFVLPEQLGAGTLVSLRSQGGRILLEIQPQGQSAIPQTGPPASTGQSAGPLAGLLDSLPALIRALQSNQLPHRTQTVQAIQNVLGQVTPDQLPILAFLLARHATITPEVLNGVRDRLRARGNLAQELGRLASGIEQLLGAGTTSNPAELSKLLSQLQGLLGWNPTGDLENRIKLLKEFLSSLEAKILAKGGSIDNDLKSLLLKLADLLSREGLPVDHPLRDAARKSLLLLEGPQLASLPNPSQEDFKDWMFFRFPIQEGDQNSTVEVALRGEKDPNNPEQMNPDDLELILQLDLEGLGPVRVRLLSADEKVQLRFSVGRIENRDLFLDNMPRLIHNLKEIGFASVSTEVRVEAVTETSLLDELGPLRAIERKMQDSAQTHQLDIKL